MSNETNFVSKSDGYSRAYSQCKVTAAILNACKGYFTIKKQFNESQLVFLPHGITAKVVSSDVIPCEDCKWWDDKYEAERCTHDFGCRWAKPNNFCGYAERRMEDADSN